MHASNALRVMSFNLLTSTKRRRSNPWRLRRRTIARIFRKYRPDVVGTQEANLRQLHELAELLPDYEFIGEGNLAGTALSGTVKSWYCAIFYRRETVRPAEDESESYWLSPTPEVPASQFMLGTRPRLATWQRFEHIRTGRDFLFGTTHLEAVNGRHRHRSSLILREYVKRKVEELGEQTPLFLTGDFNAISESREIRALQAAELGDYPLYDAWTAAGRDDEPSSATFRGLGVVDRLGGRLFGPRRIDYVFYRPQLPVIDARTIRTDSLAPRACAVPSDHYPVQADFLLGPAGR